MEKQEIDINSIFEKKYPIITTEGENGALNSTIYITQEIGAPHEIVEIVALLTAAEDGDTATFKFNTPGGRLDTTLMALDAFASTKALLIGEIVGEVASAGTMWVMAMDDIIVSEWGSMMIHNYTGGIYGKGYELKTRMEFETPFLESFMYGTYKHFLTKKEIGRIVTDKDIYMGANEIMGRWSVVMGKRQKRAEKRIVSQEATNIANGITEARAFLAEYAEKPID